MRKRGLLFASVLVIGMGMSMTALAEEGGLGGILSSLFSEDGVVSSIIHDEKAVEAINGLFEEDGPLAGVLPEDIDVNGVLENIDSQLQDANSTLNQGISSVVEMVQGEDGSIDWEKAGSSVEELIDLFAGGAKFDEEVDGDSDDFDMDAFMAEFMVPYDKADEAIFAYIAEKNADVIDAGDAQIFSKMTGYMDDPEQDEVKVLGDFTQVNYAIDGEQMNMVGAATDTLLLTLARNEDGSYTVVDEKHAEDGEGYSASVEALCEEVNTSMDDFYTSCLFGAYNDAEELAKYLEEHPEIKTAEFQGQQMTAEELKLMSEDYINSLLDSVFEDAEEAVTEAMTETITE